MRPNTSVQPACYHSVPSPATARTSKRLAPPRPPLQPNSLRAQTQQTPLQKSSSSPQSNWQSSTPTPR
ncbi:unnamed protein product [Chondrus crispus]|uniref:Uncharacterized protein n=1 Tax=Chondrus crispus TaxID=2769 RepID=R7Q9R5_CHOCR|nr:unnamed protein product [Chondrus crispus]CDF35282.1 unnamed protein product [Chondrus crispus]|eukprot:XP_005715101.1 unnamed protein product [Chondrus crispus]